MKRNKGKLFIQKIKNVEFILGRSNSLVVSLAKACEPGIERVIVENEKGRTKVTVIATSGSRFEFRDQRRSKGYKRECDFWVANLKARDFLIDVLRGKFWGQFNWGELLRQQNDKFFKKEIDRVIKKLVDEFMEQAAIELNKIKKPSR